MRLFGKVKPGMLANVVSEIATGESYQATVALVDPMGDAASGTFGVRLTLPNPDQMIPAGLKCRVGIQNESPAKVKNKSAKIKSPKLAASNKQQNSLR